MLLPAEAVVDAEVEEVLSVFPDVAVEEPIIDELPEIVELPLEETEVLKGTDTVWLES